MGDFLKCFLDLRHMQYNGVTEGGRAVLARHFETHIKYKTIEGLLLSCFNENVCVIIIVQKNQWPPRRPKYLLCHWVYIFTEFSVIYAFSGGCRLEVMSLEYRYTVIYSRRMTAPYVPPE